MGLYVFFFFFKQKTAYEIWPMDEDETIPRRRFPKKMKHLAGTQPRITHPNVLTTWRVQIVPNIVRQTHPRLRGVFPRGTEWRCLRSILRLERSRHYLPNTNSEDSGNKQRPC